MNNETPAPQFSLGSSFGRICYYPINNEAKSLIPKKRVCLYAHELTALIDAGNPVQIDLNPYLGVKYFVNVSKSPAL